jgi:hypothetical protein
MRSEHKYTLVDPPKKGGLLVFCGILSGLHHPADDLVARHAGERSHPPFVPREVDVGMADAAKIDLNVNVPVSGSAPFELKRGKGLFGRLGSISSGLHGLLRVANASVCTREGRELAT